jgi:hypothetical protein
MGVIDDPQRYFDEAFAKAEVAEMEAHFNDGENINVQEYVDEWLEQNAGINRIFVDECTTNVI